MFLVVEMEYPVYMEGVYEQIKTAIMQHKESACLIAPDGISPQDVRNALRKVMRDNPGIFWFDHQYVFNRIPGCIEFRYTFSTKRAKEIQQSINDVVDNDFCITHVRTLPVQEQIAYVYKWLVAYCNYNTNSAYNQGIYSVFVRRSSVCTGYAKAAQYLLGLLGIEARLVFGRLNGDGENGRHCWNVVKCDDAYFHFDASLGEGRLDGVAIKAGIQELFKIGDVNYAFLCTSAKEMLNTRSIEDAETLPPSPVPWPKELICELSNIRIKERDGIKGTRLSHTGSTADIYLCAKDKNTVIKEFRDTSAAVKEFRFMRQLKGCRHTLQGNETYTRIQDGLIAIEQSVPIVDLFCSYYYELSMNELARIAIDIAAAWLECKERGVIYRDIHICNIYRSDDGVYKLGDFGDCTYMEERMVVGNQWFMAPETFTSGVFTERSAIYSIGMVLYFILNNLRPAFWTPEGADEALRKRIGGEKLPLPAALHNAERITHTHEVFHDVNNDLLSILEKATAALPEERFKDFAAFLHALHSFNSNGTVIHKGVSLEMDLDAGNQERLNERWKYIPRDSYHVYAAGTTHSCNTDYWQSSCSSLPADSIEDFACSALPDFTAPSKRENSSSNAALAVPDITFAPKIEVSIWERLFGRTRHKVYSSVFAPAEVVKGRHLLAQFYFHRFKEQELVNGLALGADRNAEKRSYMPLSLRLKRGDSITVYFSIYGKTLLMSQRADVVWQGKCTRCFFEYLVPDNIETSELSCRAYISANGAMVGEVRFHTYIVDEPRNIYTDIVSRRYNRIFISYAHQDARQARMLALAYKMQGAEYFYDRDSLRAGDLWEEKILEYIDSADLFILCWSKNAAKSEYVAKEKARALIHAYPSLDINEATLKICPVSIRPKAELPDDLKEYNFEML